MLEIDSINQFKINVCIEIFSSEIIIVMLSILELHDPATPTLLTESKKGSYKYAAATQLSGFMDIH